MKIRRQIIGLISGGGLVLALGAAAFAQESTATQKMQNREQKAATAVENLQPQNIEITATDYKFSPSEFTVSPGRKIKITLVNRGKKAHNIQFDLPGDHKLAIPKNISPGEIGSVLFTAPGPGTYSFKCPVDLHSTMGMNGKMIVTGSGK